MRSIVITSCLALSFLLSCKKEDKQPAPPPNTFSATINGRPWQTTGRAEYLKGQNNRIISVLADSFNKDGIWMYSFGVDKINVDSATSIINPYTGVGNNDIICNAGMSAGIADELYDLWDVIKTADNKVSIESYDAASNRVKGSFHLSLYKKAFAGTANLYGFTDTLVITDGKFDLSVQQPQ